MEDCFDTNPPVQKEFVADSLSLLNIYLKLPEVSEWDAEKKHTSFLWHRLEMNLWMLRHVLSFHDSGTG